MTEVENKPIITTDYTIVRLSENINGYIPHEKPENSFTLERKEHMYGQVYIYKPDKTNEQYIEGIKEVNLINELTDILPSIDPLCEDNFEDYPSILNPNRNLIGVFYHRKRQIFLIGKCLFFRRYNDDHNPQMMCSLRDFNNYAFWERLCPANFPLDLMNLIKNKGINNVTREEIITIMKIKNIHSDL